MTPRSGPRLARTHVVAALLLLLSALAACGRQEPAATAWTTETASHPLPPLVPGPSTARPLPELRSLEPGIRTMDLGTLELANEIVALEVLVIAAEADDASLWAWEALLDQSGTPYDTLLATEEELTLDRLVDDDGAGRYQAILLATGDLAYEARDGTWPSAFDEAEWDLLHQYEREFDVRQVSLYTRPATLPEAYGARVLDPDLEDRTVPEGYWVAPTEEGREIFAHLADDARVHVQGVWAYPAELVEGGGAVPILRDLNGHVVAVTSVSEDGRERLASFVDHGAYGGVPQLHTQLLGPALLDWATRGVRIGEWRTHLGGDVDDWFVATDVWDTDAEAIAAWPAQFELSAGDAESFADQQDALRAEHPLASDLTWTMAFNGRGATTPTETCGADLSSMTACIAERFWWVNHTWGHPYMDYAADDERYAGETWAITYDEIVDQIARNDDVAAEFGFGDAYAPRSLVTGDVSGLGWYDPTGPNGNKVDHGLEASNEDLLAAAVATGRRYVASNMSTASHEPDCASCGIEHPLNAGVFLVPRWPTNVFAAVHTPEAATQAYNQVYGEGAPDTLDLGDLDYPTYLRVETDIALRHVLSGAAYPHYFHVANLYEYEDGRSLLTDWAEALLEKYEGYVDLPVRTLPWDELGAYVEARTSFAHAGASGTWNRATGELTLAVEDAGTVFLTGGSIRGGTDTFYAGTRISRIDLDAGGTAGAVVLRTEATLPQEIAFGELPDRDVAAEPFEIGASADSGLPVRFAAEGVCSVAGTTVTLSGAAGTCTITAYAAAPDVERSFEVLPMRTLTLEVDGDGLGVVIASPDGAACGAGTCVVEARPGAEITLVPVPVFGSTFDGWSGACGGEAGCTVTLDADAAVRARFVLAP